jgi:hypothetical protein
MFVLATVVMVAGWYSNGGYGVASAAVTSASAAAHETAVAHPAAVPLGTTNNPCYQHPSAGHCDNTDPYATDCNIGSYVANSDPVYWIDLNNGQRSGGYSGWIQNWYSPHCGTNWAMYVNTSGDTGVADIWVCRSGYCASDYSSYLFPSWSNQLYAPSVVATAYANFSEYSGIYPSGATAEGSSSA